MTVNNKQQTLLLSFQKMELNHHFVYKHIARYCKDEANRKVLLEIAEEELNHYELCKTHTNRNIKPSRSTIFFTTLLALILGYTFAIKMMENDLQRFIKKNIVALRQAPLATLLDEENQNNAKEAQLISLLDEEKLRYVGSMVLGLNDALMEISGSLAGFTFAYQNSRLIAITGIIVGIAATLSMAASDFLSERASNDKNAFLSSLYTGGAYLITVILLVLPYLLLPSNAYMTALFLMMAVALLIILVFNFYIAVAKNLPFLSRFLETAGISIAVALFSFVVGWFLKTYVGLEA